MKQFPSIPRLANAPDRLFETGHVWLLEKVDGANVRFQLQESGLIVVGDRSRVYDDPDAIPTPYRHAVRHIRENLDRQALRRAVDDPTEIVFFGEAMHHHTTEYDWQRTPSFLGFDVWSASKQQFYPFDAVERIFERLGLTPVNAFEKERRVRHFDPEAYPIPQSAWYDGPAEGVVVRNKRGDQAKLLHPDFEEVDDTVAVDATAEELAAKYATRRRFEKLTNKLDDREKPVTFDELYERTLDDIVREEHKQLHHSERDIDLQLFRSTIAGRTRSFLDDGRSDADC